MEGDRVLVCTACETATSSAAGETLSSQGHQSFNMLIDTISRAQMRCQELLQLRLHQNLAPAGTSYHSAPAVSVSAEHFQLGTWKQHYGGNRLRI